MTPGPSRPEQLDEMRVGMAEQRVRDELLWKEQDEFNKRIEAMVKNNTDWTHSFDRRMTRWLLLLVVATAASANVDLHSIIKVFTAP